jgi:hypothetical protein
MQQIRWDRYSNHEIRICHIVRNSGSVRSIWITIMESDNFAVFPSSLTDSLLCNTQGDESLASMTSAKDAKVQLGLDLVYGGSPGT